MQRMVFGKIAVIVIVVFLAHSPSVYADGIVLAQVSASADNVCVATPGFASPVSLNPRGCLNLGPPSGTAAATASQDNALTSWQIVSSATAAATLGVNRGTIDLVERAVSTLPIVSWDLGFTYELAVLMPDGTWGDVLQTSGSSSGTSFSSSVSNNLIGHFEFSAGVPYQLRSLLSVFGSSTSVRLANAAAVSEWSDVLTFTGGDAVVGADFVINLTALLFAEQSFFASVPCPNGSTGSVFCEPTYVYHSRVDLGNGAVLNNIGVRDGVRIHAASGTEYPVHVPEPETLTLLIMCSACLAVGGAKRFTYNSTQVDREKSVSFN